MQMITQRNRTTFLSLIVFLLITFGYSACMPSNSPTSRPGRKKMLDMTAGSNGWEVYGFARPENEELLQQATTPPLPFSLSDTSLLLRGERSDFLLLRVPSAEFDLLLPAAKPYESMLSAWLSSWPQLGRTGVVIDLSLGKASHRTNLQIVCDAQRISLPLVLLWDDASATRVEYLKSFIQNLSSIHCENLQ
jgi:hypothetical protein